MIFCQRGRIAQRAHRVEERRQAVLRFAPADMLTIHPSAQIHPTAVLDGEITIGADAIVGAYVVLQGPVVVGARSRIYPGCVLGTEPEHRRAGPQGRVLIGEATVLREHCVIHRGTGSRETTIGSRCYVMNQVYVGHDGLVEDDVTLSAHVALAGNVQILQGANLGMSVTVHQHSVIGAYAMVGMSAVVTRDIPPFCLVAGNPARFRRFNRHALTALGIAESDLSVQANALHSQHPQVASAQAAFLARSRRAPLRLVTEQK